MAEIDGWRGLSDAELRGRLEQRGLDTYTTRNLVVYRTTPAASADLDRIFGETQDDWWYWP